MKTSGDDETKPMSSAVPNNTVLEVLSPVLVESIPTLINKNTDVNGQLLLFGIQLDVRLSILHSFCLSLGGPEENYLSTLLMYRHQAVR